jgi:prepilin-type N-terminal cleavage/methylation domain-containing protein
MRSSDGAFTLLEVLAAVALLAIAYTALGSSGIQGLQHEGEARRRLQASLLADSAIVEIESAAEVGAAPEIGDDESEQDGFRVAVRVEPFSLEVPEDQSGAGGNRIGRARSRLGGDAGAPEPLPGPSLLGAAGSGPGAAPPPLRRIVVRVAWDEGYGERSTVRTTYALDGEAASETLAAIGQAAAALREAQGGLQPNNPLGGDDANPPGEVPFEDAQ